MKKLRLIEKEIGRPTSINFFPQLRAYTYSINSYELADIAMYLIELSIILFIPISIGLIIVLFLNTNALINYSISQSMKDFSILRSIGYSKNNIRSIIILKSLLVAIPQILIGLIIGLIMVVAFNRIMSMQTITQIIIIALDIKNFLIINVVAFLSYALVIISKSNFLFKDSAVINYKKR